jgi:hypothetical protein
MKKVLSLPSLRRLPSPFDEDDDDNGNSDDKKSRSSQGPTNNDSCA